MIRAFTVSCAAALCAAVFVLPAQAQDRSNFDIRLSAEKTDQRAVDRLRAAVPAASSRVPALTQGIASGEASLRQRIPALKLLPSAETDGPEIVAVSHGPVELSAASSAAPDVVARNFLLQNAALYGLTREQVTSLPLDASYANPAGNMRWVRFSQRINGLPLFRGDLTVALGKSGEVVRTMGQVAGGVRADEAATQPALDAADALLAAADSLGVVPPGTPAQVSTEHEGRSVTFAWPNDDMPLRTELMYFPLGKGVLELAWSTMVPDGSNLYMVVLSAIDGTVLFRKNLTNDDAYNYTVYPVESPAPLAPGPNDPALNAQGARISASVLTIESLITAGGVPTSANPWLAAGATTTDGNNVIAGLDRDGSNGVDAALATSGPLAFNYPSNPPPGIPTPGDDPLTVASQRAAITNLFYWNNRFHDITYELGFTEAARNFQKNNYGRGGAGNDAVGAEAQDSAGTNNANFATPADGGPGRMQMFLWTGPTPDRDGSLDTSIVVHEYTHGVSNRLHGNSSGLSNNLSGGMGEGWGDFYAHSILSKPTDPLNGVYALGGYATYLAAAGYTSNYFYGIRRFPKAILSAVGGPSMRPLNPLTFEDIDSTKIDLTDGAFPRGPFGVAQADQVHNVGEVWSSTLWEARSKVIGLLGPAAGNQRMLQLVTDGMKLDPAGPTPLSGRDAIIAADCAGFAGADEAALWTGFAARGMGASATIEAIASPARVTEAFDTPLGGAFGGATASNLSCGTPDRAPAPGETLALSVSITNTFCATPLTNVVVSLAGGGTTNVGAIPAGATVTALVNYTISSGAACGTSIPLTYTLTSDLGSQSFSDTVAVGEAAISTTNFSTTVDTAIPATGTTVGVASPYPSTVVVSGVTQPVVGVTVRLDSVSSTYIGDMDLLLVSPLGKKLIFLSDASTVFRSAAPPITFTFADAADAVLGTGAQVVDGGLYKPTNAGAADPFAGPAPAGPYLDAAPAGTATFASAFGGDNANGTWQLWGVDDASGDVALVSGWTLGVIVSQPVVCEACTLTLGGTLTGLAPGSSVVLQNNGGNNLTLSADGAFTFGGTQVRGDSYNVTVLTQPGSPPQTCVVGNGAGTYDGPNVADVVVTCASLRNLGGTLAGLPAAGSVSLSFDGGPALVLGANGAFTFPQQGTQGDAYTVAIVAQSVGSDRICSITSGATGTFGASDVTDVTVLCQTYAIFADSFQ